MNSNILISGNATFDRSRDVDDLIKAVDKYIGILKNGSADEMRDIYDDYATLIPENQPQITGIDNILKVYEAFYKMLSYGKDSRINIVDAFVSGSLGFVRTHDTKADMVEVKTGVTTLSHFRELWILKRNSSNVWKIFIYAYGMQPEGEFLPADAVVW